MAANALTQRDQLVAGISERIHYFVHDMDPLLFLRIDAKQEPKTVMPLTADPPRRSGDRIISA